MRSFLQHDLASEHWRRLCATIVRVGVWGRLEWNCLLDCAGSLRTRQISYGCLHKTCTRLRQSISQQREDQDEDPHPQLRSHGQSMGSGWAKLIFFKLWSLEGWPWSIGFPQSHEDTGSTSWPFRVIQRNTEGMSQWLWLKFPAALIKVLSLIPNSHIRWLTSALRFQV